MGLRPGGPGIGQLFIPGERYPDRRRGGYPARADTLELGDGSQVPFSSDLEMILVSTRPDVIVDFTLAPATLPAVRLAAKYKVNLVIGTTGLTAANLAEIERLAQANRLGVIVASNFALGSSPVDAFCQAGFPVYGLCRNYRAPS